MSHYTLRYIPALPCGPNHIANMDIAHVASTLSELNLMTYGENLIVLHVQTLV